MKAFLEAGKIVNTHGIRGDLKVEIWCDDYETFHGIPTLYVPNSDTYQPYRVTKNTPYKGGALIHLSEIEDIDAAQQLKGRTVFAAREDLALPPDRVFIADILSLPVIDANTGAHYGILVDVTESGTRQLYEIRRDGGAIAYLPAIKEFIDRIEPEHAIYITPPEGLFT